jgi:hypothetical protein
MTILSSNLLALSSDIASLKLYLDLYVFINLLLISSGFA